MTYDVIEIMLLVYVRQRERERESSPRLELHRSESRWRNSQKVA